MPLRPSQRGAAGLNLALDFPKSGETARREASPTGEARTVLRHDKAIFVDMFKVTTFVSREHDVLDK
jgi:hypothetical protein